MLCVPLLELFTACEPPAFASSFQPYNPAPTVVIFASQYHLPVATPNAGCATHCVSPLVVPVLVFKLPSVALVPEAKELNVLKFCVGLSVVISLTVKFETVKS